MSLLNKEHNADKLPECGTLATIDVDEFFELFMQNHKSWWEMRTDVLAKYFHYTIIGIEYRKSYNENTHVLVCIKQKLTPIDKSMFEYMLGDDPYRNLYGLWRYLLTGDPQDILFVHKGKKKKKMSKYMLAFIHFLKKYIEVEKEDTGHDKK